MHISSFQQSSGAAFAAMLPEAGQEAGYVCKDADVETECKMKHDLELPSRNNHPHVLYVMKKLFWRAHLLNM